MAFSMVMLGTALPQSTGHAEIAEVPEMTEEPVDLPEMPPEPAEGGIKASGLRRSRGQRRSPSANFLDSFCSFCFRNLRRRKTP